MSLEGADPRGVNPTDPGSRAEAGPIMVVPATAGPPGPPPQITIEAIEVSQAIQDLTMSVRLIAGKPTVVRVYLGTSFGPVVVIAALRVTSVADPTRSQTVSPIADVEVDTGENGRVGMKRREMAKSLNFLWPRSWPDRATGRSDSRPWSGSTSPSSWASRDSLTRS